MHIYAIFGCSFIFLSLISRCNFLGVISRGSLHHTSSVRVLFGVSVPTFVINANKVYIYAVVNFDSDFSLHLIYNSAHR